MSPPTSFLTSTVALLVAFAVPLAARDDTSSSIRREVQRRAANLGKAECSAWTMQQANFDSLAPRRFNNPTTSPLVPSANFPCANFRPAEIAKTTSPPRCSTCQTLNRVIAPVDFHSPSRHELVQIGE
jgi:hypothetical protein